jgi:hypothetical protein
MSSLTDGDSSDRDGWRFAGDEVSPEQPVAHRPLSSGDLANSWGLDEFFEALGPVMRLPPKEDEAPVAAPSKKSRKPQFLVTLALIMLLGATGWSLIQMVMSRSERLPLAFTGKWTTANHAYADRMFEITGDTFRLQLATDSIASYPIIGVHSREQDGVRWYTIAYGTRADRSEIVLGLDPDSTMHIAHQPAIAWRKVTR